MSPVYFRVESHALLREAFPQLIRIAEMNRRAFPALSRISTFNPRSSMKMHSAGLRCVMLSARR